MIARHPICRKIVYTSCVPGICLTGVSHLGNASLDDAGKNYRLYPSGVEDEQVQSKAQEADARQPPT